MTVHSSPTLTCPYYCCYSLCLDFSRLNSFSFIRVSADFSVSWKRETFTGTLLNFQLWESLYGYRNQVHWSNIVWQNTTKRIGGKSNISGEKSTVHGEKKTLIRTNALVETDTLTIIWYRTKISWDMSESSRQPCKKCKPNSKNWRVQGSLTSTVLWD